MSDCCQPGKFIRPNNAGNSAEESPKAPVTEPVNGTFPLNSPSANQSDTHPAQVQIPSGQFAMGDPFDEGYPADGETPVHPVRISAFTIDESCVTNTAFAAFVEATGYRTESEIYGTSAVFHLAVASSPADILGAADGTPWWLNVRGANWAHPGGALSSWHDIPDHPVTQVSHTDALAYCEWAGRALPTEAQWEYAARGGMEQARYPWGNELHGTTAEGAPLHHCNIWQGTFPSENTCDDGFLTTAPVHSFEPNGYGLFQTSGNVWEWCSDWFLPKYYKGCLAKGTVQDPQGPTIGRGRVMRGGSYLCHDSYCNRYRLAARSSNTADSASGNLGFRTVSLS